MILAILHFPDPRLRTKAEPVEFFDAKLQTLIDNMFETMYENNGCGLAATQVNVHLRLFVMDLSADRSEPRVFVNPEILSCSEEKREGDEGCLSFPGIYEKVERAHSLKLRYQDPTGKVMEVEVQGFPAVCIQHETDHLNGKMLVDYQSSLKRSRILKKLKKAKRITL